MGFNLRPIRSNVLSRSPGKWDNICSLEFHVCIKFSIGSPNETWTVTPECVSATLWPLKHTEPHLFMHLSKAMKRTTSLYFTILFYLLSIPIFSACYSENNCHQRRNILFPSERVPDSLQLILVLTFGEEWQKSSSLANQTSLAARSSKEGSDP